MLNIIVAPKDFCPRAEKSAKKVAGYLKSRQEEYSVYFSHDTDELIENVNYLVGLGESEFVLIGDDRILSQFVNTVQDLSRIKLGLIPVSRHDDFASYLGISSNPIAAIKDVLERQIQNVDILICNDRRVVNNVVIGASVNIYEAYNNYTWKNIITEKYASFKYTKSYSPINLKIDVKNTKTRTVEVFELIVANGGYSKGKKLSPLSNVKDGLFNLIYIPEENRKGLAGKIRTIFNGEHIYADETAQLWGDEVKLTSESQNIKAMLDGEVYNLERIDISVKEGALKIYKSN